MPTRTRSTPQLARDVRQTPLVRIAPRKIAWTVADVLDSTNSVTVNAQDVVSARKSGARRLGIPYPRAQVKRFEGAL